MATEVSVKIRDSKIGQALFIKQEEWDLSLSEIRALLEAQEVETPLQYRFLTGNGNVVSTTLEDTVIFRDVVDQEPFAEIKKEDISLHSAEERVTPQILIVPFGSLDSKESEKQCPFISKFPIFSGARGIIPCARNLFTFHTLLKMAFILTCLLFLLVFVVTLLFHFLFGLGAVGGLSSYGILGSSQLFQQQTPAFDQEALTALRVKISEIEVANRFEIQDLKQKLSELEDMNLSLFKELEAAKKELSVLTAAQPLTEMPISEQMTDLSLRMAELRDLHDSRQINFITPQESIAFNKAVADALNHIRIDDRIERLVLELNTIKAERDIQGDTGEDIEIVEGASDEKCEEKSEKEEEVVNQESIKEVEGEAVEELVKEEDMEESRIEGKKVSQENKVEEEIKEEKVKNGEKDKKEKKNKKDWKSKEGKNKDKENKKQDKENKNNKKDEKKNKGKDKKKEKKNKK